MTSFDQSRMEIYRKTRTVLVRHWIDLGRLSIVVSPSAIRLHGTLCRLPGVKNELTPTIIDAMLRELRRQTGTTRVITDFRNWREDSGSWIPVETGEKELEPTERQEMSRIVNIPVKENPEDDVTQPPAP